jgi:hypothetical protein
MARLAVEAAQLQVRSAVEPVLFAYQRQVQDMARLAVEAAELNGFQRQVQDMARLAVEAAQFQIGQAVGVGAAMRSIDRN